MQLLKYTVAAIAFVATAGCSTIQGWSEDDYVVRTATPDSITLEYRAGNLNVATERAMAHCRESNRSAKMMDVSTTSDKSLARFDCQY
jgi:hypothetical protein